MRQLCCARRHLFDNTLEYESYTYIMYTVSESTPVGKLKIWNNESEFRVTTSSKIPEFKNVVKNSSHHHAVSTVTAGSCSTTTTAACMLPGTVVLSIYLYYIIYIL